MRIDASVTVDDKVRHLADRLTGPQFGAAQAAAINDTAFKVRGVMVAALTSAFDRPTPFIARSPKVLQATPENLTARIVPTLDARGVWTPGGKIGVDPQHVLQAQEFGGRRADKRSEVALRRAGILPAGMQTVIPERAYPGSDDGRGNLRGAFLSQLISYLQASSEQGYRANMTDRRKAQLRNQQGIGSIANRKVYQTTLGVRYFVAYGRSRGGRGRHLAPGVWAARGTHDSDIAPVLLFVRLAGYRSRISMDDIASKAQAAEVLARRMRYRIRQAAGVLKDTDMHRSRFAWNTARCSMAEAVAIADQGARQAAEPQKPVRQADRSGTGPSRGVTSAGNSHRGLGLFTDVAKGVK